MELRLLLCRRGCEEVLGVEVMNSEEVEMWLLLYILGWLDFDVVILLNPMPYYFSLAAASIR